MATTAYERFLKDQGKDEAVEVDIKEQKPFDLDEVKLKIQNTLIDQTEPKKPVNVNFDSFVFTLIFEESFVGSCSHVMPPLVILN